MPPVATSARASFLVAVVLVVAAMAAFLVRTRHYDLLGMDTFPAIASGILRSPSDVVTIFTSPAVPGRVPYAFRGFYRPITTISLGFDQLLFGVAPRGYFVHQALLFGACAIALYALARRLLGSRAVIGPLATLLVFLLAPSHVETLAVVARRSELLCGVFCMLALLLQDTRDARWSFTHTILPAFFTFLGIVSKTTALALLPTVFVLVLTRSPRVGLIARAWHALRATVPHVIAVAIAFAIQIAILHDVGGHIMSRSSGAVDRLPWALGQILWWLLVPQEPLRTSLVTWLLLLAIPAGLLAVLALLRRQDAAPRLADVSRPGTTAAVAVVWLLSLASLYGAVGLLQGWYVFLPAAAFALLCGAAAETLWIATRAAVLPLRATAAATLVLLALWTLWQGRYSMLLHPYTYIDRASTLTRDYVADLTARIAAAPDDGTIFVPPPPRRLEPLPDELTLDGPLLLQEYAFQSWVECALPERKIVVHDRRKPLAPDGPPGTLRVVFRP
jgi:hypothetical protein